MSNNTDNPHTDVQKVAGTFLTFLMGVFVCSSVYAESIEFRHEGGVGLHSLPGPHAITRIFKNGNTSPASVLFYDRNGLLTDVTGDMPLCHEFNVLGKLKRASSELRNNGSCTGATSISYLYTATGEKLAVIESNQTNVFMGEVRFTNNIPRLSYGGDVETSEDGSSLNYYVRDHLGSVVATASPSQILEKRDHLPYGETWYHTQAGNEFSDQDFNGHYKQGSLLDYNARHYHPTLGKFIQPDSIVPKTDTVGFNRYAYVSNNPVNRIDPSGHNDLFVQIFDRLPLRAQQALLPIFNRHQRANGRFEFVRVPSSQMSNGVVLEDFYYDLVANGKFPLEIRHDKKDHVRRVASLSVDDEVTKVAARAASMTRELDFEGAPRNVQTAAMQVGFDIDSYLSNQQGGPARLIQAKARLGTIGKWMSETVDDIKGGSKAISRRIPGVAVVAGAVFGMAENAMAGEAVGAGATRGALEGLVGSIPIVGDHLVPTRLGTSENSIDWNQPMTPYNFSDVRHGFDAIQALYE